MVEMEVFKKEKRKTQEGKCKPWTQKNHTLLFHGLICFFSLNVSWSKLNKKGKTCNMFSSCLSELL